MADPWNLGGAKRVIEDGLGEPMDDPDGLRRTAIRLLEIVEVLQNFADKKTDWGKDPSGRRRRPCPEKPVLLLGAPLGQYHCTVCGEMQVAGIPHLPPDRHYEKLTGRDWPPGYVGLEGS